MPPAPQTAALTQQPRKPWYRQLYLQVLIAIAVGIGMGWRWPDQAVSMEPFGTTFIAAMRMLMAPIVFLTIIGGVAGVADLRKVGRTGLRALVYFQVGTILALLIGLAASNVFRLGEGVHANPATMTASGTAEQAIRTGEHRRWWELFTRIVPDSFFGAFTEGDILQVIFLAVIFGVALKAVGPSGEPIIAGVQRLTDLVFTVLAFILRAAPLGAFGAMAFAIGKFGLSTLTGLGSLVLLFYATSIVFVLGVLGALLAIFARLNIFLLIRYLKNEFLLILGTSATEPALPGLMRKLQQLGVDRSTVKLVVPTGYSVNLDGAAIYLSLAALYIAQATDTSLSVGQQVGMLAVMLLTSKGAAGVVGAGFMALTATLATMGQIIPAVGIMLVFGIDKFMAECRALVNFSGNAVATVLIAAWEHNLDLTRARAVLAGHLTPDPPSARDGAAALPEASEDVAGAPLAGGDQPGVAGEAPGLAAEGADSPKASIPAGRKHP